MPSISPSTAIATWKPTPVRMADADWLAMRRIFLSGYILAKVNTPHPPCLWATNLAIPLLAKIPLAHSALYFLVPIGNRGRWHRESPGGPRPWFAAHTACEGFASGSHEGKASSRRVKGGRWCVSLHYNSPVWKLTKPLGSRAIGGHSLRHLGGPAILLLDKVEG